MIILITGASHTGKTLLAQKLLEKHKYPYLSMDHVKMGLIRSGKTTLTPFDDDRMTEYLWPVIREIIKTAIENGQDLIVEGAYVPAGWERDFEPEYLREIEFFCIVMTERYIRSHFDEIKNRASVIENRVDDEDFTLETAVSDNEFYLSAFGGSDGLLLIEENYGSEISNFISKTGIISSR